MSVRKGPVCSRQWSWLHERRSTLPRNRDLALEVALETMDCCADCGSVAGGDISLKACKLCMSVKYCNVACQRRQWPKHKKY